MVKQRMVRFERKRYLLIHVAKENGKIEGQKVREAIFNTYIRLFGLKGLGEAKLSWISFDGERNLGILRCSHRALPRVRAAIALTSTIEGLKARICTVRVSGTIKSIKDFVKEEFKA